MRVGHGVSTDSLWYRTPADLVAPFYRPLPPRRGNTTERQNMYIGLGTILVIALLFFLFRAMSGRRV